MNNMNQQTGGGGGGGGPFAPAFGGFMNDQTAAMGFQVGRSAVMAGQEYMEQNVRTDPPNVWPGLTLRV